MLKLSDVCYIISRGKTLSDKYKALDGDIYNLRLTHIGEDGSVILADEYRYKIENKGNIMYFYGAKENDLIFPELVSPYTAGQSLEEINFLRDSNEIKEGCNSGR